MWGPTVCGGRPHRKWGRSRRWGGGARSSLQQGRLQWKNNKLTTLAADISATFYWLHVMKTWEHAMRDINWYCWKLIVLSAVHGRGANLEVTHSQLLCTVCGHWIQPALSECVISLRWSSLVPSHTGDKQKRKLCLYQHLEPCWMSHLVLSNVSPIWNGLLAVTEIQATSFAQYVHRYTKKTFSLWGRCMSLHYEHGSTKYRRTERWWAGDSLADLWPESQALCQDEGPHFVL